MNAEPRSVCYRCFKPHVTCVCRFLTCVENRTGIFIVQHPRERLHAIGTARLAALGLDKVRLDVMWDAGTRESTRPAWLPDSAALLYPARGARDLETLAAHERPSHLVVIDGTWHTARTLYRDKNWLRSIPCYKLSPATASRYRIRREPTRESLSTVEAIVEALRVLEPDLPNVDSLLGAFDSIIDRQLAYVRRGTSDPRTKTKRPRAWRRVPRALMEDFEHLVVGYGESSRSDPRGPRELVQWTAVALAGGQTFERLIRPSFGLPSKTHLDHMGLGDADFENAVSVESFERDWSHFLETCGPRPLVAAWNQTTLDVLASATRGMPSRVSLKGAYRSARGGGSGSLDDVALRERVRAPKFTFRGRAAVRLARAVAIARDLNQNARGHAT
jgi:DTW domain-containing protein YfiP